MATGRDRAVDNKIQNSLIENEINALVKYAGTLQKDCWRWQIAKSRIIYLENKLKKSI